MEAAPRSQPGRHGWWPYVLPYLSFLVVADSFDRWMSDAWDPLLLVLKPAVPGILLLYFALKGEYPELRRQRLRLGPLLSDVLVGVALAALWTAPYICIESIRPEATDGFRPGQLGAELIWLTLGLRTLGFALVTPFFEELFIRSFVMRFSEVFRTGGDFRNVPLARFSAVGFASTVVVFTITHAPWEYWVAVPWVVLTNLWFYYRKSLYAAIVVHASTNAAILGFVVATGGRASCGTSAPLPLWFFM
jgi:CAAX prenyl protease-like protein